MAGAMTIERMVYPLLVEVKHLFVKSLPNDLTIREKRLRVIALDVTCDQLLNMNLEEFNFRCARFDGESNSNT
jgi:hypothetical protein